MYGYIYKTTNLVNGKIYVGKKRGEFTSKYFGSGRYLNNALNKYGKDNFSVELLEYCDSLEQQNNQEKYWIAYFKDLGCDMYNISRGGDGGDTYYGLSDEDRNMRCEKTSKVTVFRHLPVESRKKAWETRRKNGTDKFSTAQLEKMSKSHLGKKQSKETVMKKSMIRLGTHLSEETKRKISESNKGKKRSIETRMKMSKINKQRVGELNGFYGKHHSDSTKKLIGSYNKSRFADRLWINNGIVNKRVLKTDLEQYIIKGFKIGRLSWK